MKSCSFVPLFVVFLLQKNTDSPVFEILLKGNDLWNFKTKPFLSVVFASLNPSLLFALFYINDRDNDLLEPNVDWSNFKSDG